VRCRDRPRRIDAPGKISPRPVINMEENSTVKPLDRDDLWKQLQNAVSFRIGEDQIKWNVFSLFSAANTVLILALSSLASFNPLSRSRLGLVVSGVGVLLALVWWGIERRALQYMEFFESAQRDLEKKLGIDPALSLTRMRSSEKGSVAEKSLGRVREWSRPLMMSLIGVALFAWLASVMSRK
jgi:hypothetical protein